MTLPAFTFDEEANAWLSDDLDIDEPIRVRLELVSPAPVVTLKREGDGGWATYGQSPKDARCYEITIHPTEPMTIKLAVPVEVQKYYIL